MQFNWWGYLSHSGVTAKGARTRTRARALSRVRCLAVIAQVYDNDFLCPLYTNHKETARGFSFVSVRQTSFLQQPHP